MMINAGLGTDRRDDSRAAVANTISRTMRRLLILLAPCALLANGCMTSTPPAVALPTSPVGMPTETDKLRIAPDTPQRVTQLPRTVIDYDHTLLTDNERQVVAKLIEASRQIDEIFLRQVSEDNPSM